MAFPGSTDLGAAKSVYDEQQDYRPNDTNLAEGTVCVFDNTSGDNRCVVLPNHANALLGGRAYAGIYAETASPNLTQDTSVAVQRGGIAKCALKDSTACTRGGTAAYDPADSGKVVPYTLAKQVPIGEFVQTLASGTSQFVGVALGKNCNKTVSLIDKIAGPSATLTALAAETAFDKTLSIPANLLSTTGMVRIRGSALCLNNGTNTTVLKLYWGTTAIVTSPGTPTPTASDAWNFDILVDVRGATTAWVSGSQGALAVIGTATERVHSGTAALTIDTTAAVTLSVKVTYGGNSANDQMALESFACWMDGNSGY